MLIQKCINCGCVIGIKESDNDGTTGSFCDICLFWTIHFNHFRRQQEKKKSNTNVVIMEICKKFLIERQREKSLKGGDCR